MTMSAHFFISIVMLEEFSSYFGPVSEFLRKFVPVMVPGYNRLILISGSSHLSASKKPFTANFDAQYGTLKGSPMIPDADDMTMICPLDFRSGLKACLVKLT